jgi:glycosyltransferase involved in cell wall biosynthesis
MNILYLLPFWPYLYTPWLFREIAWMRRRGHQVAVIALAPPPGPRADLSVFGLEDAPVLELRRPYGGAAAAARSLMCLGPAALTGGGWRQAVRAKGLRQGTWEWANLARMVRFARRQGTQVIEAHWATEAADAARELHLAAGLPYAVRMHGGDLYRNPSPNLPRIAAHASALCPVSGFLADLLRGRRPVPRLPVVPPVEVDPAKLRICHNGVPEQAIAHAPAAQNAQHICVASVGRLDPEKRHADLVAAVAALAPRFPGVSLRLIGGGQLEPALRRQATELGIADRLEITGALPWEKVIQAVGSAHVYAQASEVEGFGLAVAEGAAQGLPLVLTRTGVHPQLVDPGVNGYLYDAGDVPALTADLGRVLGASAEERTKMGARSLAVIRERFCFETLIARVEAILDAVRQGQPLPA